MHQQYNGFQPISAITFYTETVRQDNTTWWVGNFDSRADVDFGDLDPLAAYYRGPRSENGGFPFQEISNVLAPLIGLKY